MLLDRTEHDVIVSCVVVVGCVVVDLTFLFLCFFVWILFLISATDIGQLYSVGVRSSNSKDELTLIYV